MSLNWLPFKRLLGTHFGISELDNTYRSRTLRNLGNTWTVCNQRMSNLASRAFQAAPAVKVSEGFFLNIIGKRAGIVFGSYLLSIGGQIHLLYKTNIIHVALVLYSNRSQKTSQTWYEHQWHTRLHFVCHFFVLTTFWFHLWFLTEKTQGYMEVDKYWV